MENISPERRERVRDPIVHNGVLGMLLFLATEAMFFGGLISAFIVNRSENLGNWPPPWQPRLPVELTAINTVFLIISGITMFLLARELKKEEQADSGKSNILYVLTMVFGLIFVAIQGTEWVKLVNAGLSSDVSLFSAFFYTIIGLHGIHVVLGLLYLIYVGIRFLNTDDAGMRSRFVSTTSVYWYFVVGLWPILYVLVYLL